VTVVTEPIDDIIDRVINIIVNPLPVNNGLRCPLAAANLPEKRLLAFTLQQRRCFPLIGDRHYTRKSYRLLT
jgi:hypothetical protein